MSTRLQRGRTVHPMYRSLQSNGRKYGFLVASDSNDLFEHLRYIIASTFGSDGDTRIPGSIPWGRIKRLTMAVY